MSKLIYLFILAIFLSGCSTTLNTPSPLERIEVLKEHVAYDRQMTQEFLDSLKRGMSEDEVYSLLKPLMDEGIAYVRYKTEDASSLEKIEYFQIAFTFEKDILLTFLNNVLDSWLMGD
ncbi:MAG: hypothetical protein NTW64_06460 [Candidatus Omnitrophica bacterium]|nr:hypothetical protein [Candidatus Omnitrophota bacterium]